MEYTFGTVFLLNIPLVFAEYICCMILTYALTRRKPAKGLAALLFVLYSLLLIVPASLFYLWSIAGKLPIVLVISLLEMAGWTITLMAAYHQPLETALLDSGMVVLLYGILEELGGFWLTHNYNLSIPGELAAYIVSTITGVLVFGFLVAGILLKCHLYETYNAFLQESRGFRWWKAGILLLPVLKILCVEITNERLTLNNSNPMISLLFLVLILSVLHYAFRCDIQKKQLQEQLASIKQQQLYIQNLESVQKDVRIFRHDFKNRMAGLWIQADRGDFRAVQQYLSEVAGDFEQKVGEKIFQASQMGNIQVVELKSLLTVKAMEMQRKHIPFRLEAAAPVTNLTMPAGDLCRAVGILLDNAMEETEAFLQNVGVSEKGAGRAMLTAVFYQERSGVSIRIQNPVKEEVELSRIWEDGYSTKGRGRGTGLTSLRRIVETYDHVSSRTYQNRGIFVQELHIRRVEKR